MGLRSGRNQVHPDIAGVQYQQGTRASYEVRAYVLLKWNHRCAYCDACQVPLELDHLQEQPERLARILAQAKTPLRDAAAVNATRWALFERVKGFQTGDLVRAVVTSGTKPGICVGKVAVRTRGVFNIQTAQGTVTDIQYRFCKVVARSDGYYYHSRKEAALPPAA